MTVVELRQYVLHPGRRGELVELFDREFVEPQERHGLRVIGTFTDLDDPDRFVWFRGFPDMTARRAGLEAFYDGPVWQRHREQANATMIDSDDVLLLRPVVPFVQAPAAVVEVTVFPLTDPPEAEFLPWFQAQVEPLLVAAGSPLLSLLVTDPSPNSFPRLPYGRGSTSWSGLPAFETRTRTGRIGGRSPPTRSGATSRPSCEAGRWASRSSDWPRLRGPGCTELRGPRSLSGFVRPRAGALLHRRA